MNRRARRTLAILLAGAVTALAWLGYQRPDMLVWFANFGLICG